MKTRCVVAGLGAVAWLVVASVEASAQPGDGGGEASPPSSPVAALLLGPWAAPVVFDLNANLPVFDLDTLDFKVFGDVLLGYQTEQLGVVGRGAISAWDLTQGAEIADTTAPEGELDLWYVTAPGAWRQEVRVQLRGAYLDTSVIRADGVSEELFRDETSLLLRAHALVGLRYAEGGVAFGVWAGAGYQRESFELLTVSQAAEVQTLERGDDALLLSARLRGQLPLWEEALVLRGRVDVLTHSLTRSVREAPGAAPALVRADQLEGTGRLFFDLEVVRLWGFVPALNLGLDLVAQRLEGEEAAIFAAPSVGAGFRRVAF